MTWRRIAALVSGLSADSRFAAIVARAGETAEVDGAAVDDYLASIAVEKE